MKFTKSVFAALLVAGMAVVMSGCATCCGGEKAAPAPKAKESGMLRGTLGVDDCEKSSSPLQIEKVMPNQVVVGKPYQYTIHVTNNSACALEDVTVMEKVPENYSLDSSVPKVSSVMGRLAQWDLGYLKPGETQTITITGTAKSGGSLVSCTKATYNPVLCLGPGVGIPAILLEVIDTEDPVQVGGMEKFYVTVTNQGNAADGNIVVRVEFEENFEYVSSSGPTQGKVEGKRAVEFAPLASLAPKQKATWEVVAKAMKEGDHRTSVKLNSDALKRSVDETEATRIY